MCSAEVMYTLILEFFFPKLPRPTPLISDRELFLFKGEQNARAGKECPPVRMCTRAWQGYTKLVWMFSLPSPGRRWVHPVWSDYP